MWLISPLAWLLIAFLLVCVSGWWRRYWRTLLIGGTALALLAILAMTPMFANALVGYLETAVPRARDCTRHPPEVAVVLAGGVTGATSGPGDISVLELASRRRIDRAVAWWRAAPRRRLVMSGGSWFDDGIPESRLMAQYARALGVPASAMVLDGASLTTWQSAQRLAAMQPPLPRRVALVTSAMHMPRAVFAMREAGFEICPVPADSRRVPFELPGYLIPQRSALEKTEAGLHEIIGMLYYRWRAGRS